MRSIQLALLSLILLVTSTTAKTTTIGIETEEGSHAVTIPMDDCHYLDEEEVYKVAISKKCRFFTGPGCTGRNTLLEPGEHASSEAVMLTSVLCEEPDPF
ncbi:hypothetical protein P175DRAFT_076735 [Aspergillus ochraceoroseus IBT 24754]|uniref:Uncharacterized protein n=3 Tax=Aspergillus subgen. Nidulantes TaxID=2720870 RepID=A0A0F8WNU3_9EURO|nr:uncharacterized protein P175DRAFT_076735 [Aspergillus ochraceoroseus IBT 24754]KKK19360.1 hypothetical protein ARAM_004440 [Aspergillus rambellii]KKK22178.1 hypothetical protein AOCH_005296 [Aspergillus ochraceoroseus]PTU25347.1 hypothetical protein P175DRAFT_076735 [Aspergillus ochraceoroseus IBT 24754]